jgi:hypothetical protein
LENLFSHHVATLERFYKNLDRWLRNPPQGTSVAVRRQGVIGKNTEVPGFSEREVTRLLHAYELTVAKVVQRSLEEITGLSTQAPQISPTPVEETTQAVPPTQDVLTKFVQSGASKYVSISSPMPPKPEVEHGDHLTKHVSDLQSQATLGSERRERPKPYPHENVGFHMAQLQAEALGQQTPKKGVVYQSSHAKLLFDALGNPNHSNRREAEQAVRGFAQAVERSKGVSINSAAREFNVPSDFLLRWAKKRGIIPILLEGKGSGSATLIDKGKAQEVAELYHEAKQLGIQPVKLLEKKKASS